MKMRLSCNAIRRAYPLARIARGGRNRPHGRRRAAPAARRVVAVDRNEAAPGLAAADEGEVVDFTDVEAVTDAGRRHRVDGVLTVSADRAVPVVAAVADAL
jgi:hypothetical protein